jgi:hypothetical protein
MSGFFREALERGIAAGSSARARIGDPKRLSAAVAAIPGVSGPNLTGPRIEELQKLIRAGAANKTLDKLPRRTVREACAALLVPPEPIAQTPQALTALFGEIARRKQRSAMLALIATYIEHFSQTAEFDRFAKGLRRLVAKWPWRQEDSWERLEAEIQFFDHEKAPEQLAVRTLEGHDTPRDVLARLGIEGEARQFSGLAEASFKKACSQIAGKPEPSILEFQRRLIDWAWAPSGDLDFSRAFNQRRHENGRAKPSGDLAFPGAFKDLACGLLLPWQTKDPDKAHQGLIMNALQKLGGGDPRMGSARWRTVRSDAPDAYAVIMRWLTRESVLGFLDIVDRSLTEFNERRMWAFRRAFWTSYLLGLDGSPEISEAWVAFGSRAAPLARRAAAVTDNGALSSFGLHHDPTRAAQSALVMRIGDFTVAEWSHNGKCNVWARSEKGAPELYKKKYETGELSSALEENKFVHMNAEGFGWQMRVAGKLEGRTFYSPRPSWKAARV